MVPGLSLWVSDYRPNSCNAHAVAIEHMVIKTKGWERDTAVTEPTET